MDYPPFFYPVWLISLACSTFNISLGFDEMAELGTLVSHIDGGVPTICLEIPQLNSTWANCLPSLRKQVASFMG